MSLAGAVLCVGALATPVQAEPLPPWIALDVPQRAGIGWRVSITIHAGQGNATGCDGCTVNLEFRAEGTKTWKRVAQRVLNAQGYANQRVTIRRDGDWRVRSTDGKSRSGIYSLDAGHPSAVKVTRPKNPNPGPTVKVTGTAISQVGGKWRGIKGRQVCLYGAGQKKIVCTTTGPRGKFSVKVKTSTRKFIFLSSGNDTYMNGMSQWFSLIPPA